MLDTFLMTLSTFFVASKTSTSTLLPFCHPSSASPDPQLHTNGITQEELSTVLPGFIHMCVEIWSVSFFFFFFMIFPSLLISIPGWVYNTVCFSVFLLMDIWAFSSFGLTFWETALLNFTSWKCTDAYLAVFPPGHPELFPCCSEEVGWF